MSSVYVIKLSSGQTLIATVHRTDSCEWTISDVFSIERRMSSSGEAYEALSSYTTYLPSRTTTVTLNANQIVLSFQPDQEFIDYYSKMSDYYWEDVYPSMREHIQVYLNGRQKGSDDTRGDQSGTDEHQDQSFDTTFITHKGSKRIN